MSIADRITSMSNNLSNAYDGIEYLGVDTTGVDKNIQNLSTVLDTVYNDYPKVSDEGISPSITGSRVGRLSSTLKGNTSQDGTPTPSNPVDINVVKGENNIVVCGKNLLPYPYYSTTTTAGRLTWTDNGDGTVTVDGENNTTNTTYFTCVGSRSLFGIPLAAGTYTTSLGSSSNVRATIARYNNISSVIALIDANTNKTTFTLNKDEKGTFALAVNKNLSVNNIIVKPMIERGSEATTYEPYTGMTLPITLPIGMELCKIGDYQDYIYRESGNWYLYKAVGKVVLDGTENWGLSNGVYYADSIENYSRNNNIPFSTHLQGRDNVNNASTFYNFGDLSIGFNSGNSTNRLYIRYDNITELADFETWLSSNNVTVYYVLVTPTTTQITDTTLISQLNALYNAMSYNGETNILQANADLPFIIQASALKGE